MLQTAFASKERSEGVVVTFILNVLFAWGTITSWGKESLPPVYAYSAGSAGVALVADLVVTSLLVGFLPPFFLVPKVKVLVLCLLLLMDVVCVCSSQFLCSLTSVRACECEFVCVCVCVAYVCLCVC